MGKIFSCFHCGCSETNVIPLETLPKTLKYSNVSLARNYCFHRPVQTQFYSRSSQQNLSIEMSICSSLATISLGSVQTLSSSQCDNTEGEELSEDRQESPPSSKRHPGLFTPEPDEGILNSSGLPPGKTGQECSPTLPQMIDRRQSRVANLFTARASTPRPGESTIIMVKPYLDSSMSSHDIPEENEPQRVCLHGIPLAGVSGDPHEVNCALCERPGSRGGRALAGLIAFRRTQSKKRKTKSLFQRKKLTEYQEKTKKTTEEYDNALRKFAERHQNND